jgi:DHA2 family multidrug resistance protein-like MFS transporter
LLSPRGGRGRVKRCSSRDVIASHSRRAPARIVKLTAACDVRPMEPKAYPASDDGIPMPQRIWAVVAISIGVVMSTLDGAIANIALPSIASDLNASVPASVWVINGYQLTIAVLLLAMSSVAEIIGLRRVFWFGLLLFTAASAGCGLANSLTTLVGARAIQGIGSACIFATYPALLAHIYPRHMLGRGIGISAMIVAMSSALGPTVSAGILSVAHWEWLFFVNVPLGILGLGVGAYTLPKTATIMRRFDVGAAVMSGVAIALLIIGIDGLGRAQDRVLASVEIVLALSIATWLIRSQGRQKTPLVPVDLLRLPIFALSVATSICSYSAQAALLVALPFLFQHQMGWSAGATGLIMTPIPLAVATIGFIAGRLADRYSAGILCGIGLLVMAFGIAGLVLLTQQPSVMDVIWREALVGLGFGLFQTPNNRVLLSAGPRHRSASAGGMLATARLIGQTTGVTLVAIVYELARDDASQVVLTIACAITLVGCATSFLRETPRGRATARS